MSPFGLRKRRVIWFRNERSSRTSETCSLALFGQWDSARAQVGWVMVNMNVHQKRKHGVKQHHSQKSQWGPRKQHRFYYSSYFMKEMWPYCTLWRTPISFHEGQDFSLIFWDGCLNPVWQPASASQYDCTAVLFGMVVWKQRMGLSHLYFAV